MPLLILLLHLRLLLLLLLLMLLLQRLLVLPLLLFLLLLVLLLLLLLLLVLLLLLLLQLVLLLLVLLRLLLLQLVLPILLVLLILLACELLYGHLPGNPTQQNNQPQLGQADLTAPTTSQGHLHTFYGQRPVNAVTLSTHLKSTFYAFLFLASINCLPIVSGGYSVLVEDYIWATDSWEIFFEEIGRIKAVVSVKHSSPRAF